MDAFIMFFYLSLWLTVFLLSKRNILFYVFIVFPKGNARDEKDSDESKSSNNDNNIEKYGYWMDTEIFSFF